MLSEPEQPWATAPLPPAFGSPAELYNTMKSLVLDEAFAMVREGLSSRKRAVTLHMRIDSTLRASERGARLGAISVTAVGASASDLSSALRSGSVFCLCRGDYQILAVVDGRSQDGGGKCLFEVSDASLVRSAGALSDGSLWTARCVASVLTQQRCADACLRQPKVTFMRNLLGARPRCHIRFDGEGQAEAGDAVGGAGSEGANDGAEAVGAAAAYSTDLNSCQRRVVEALGASQNGAVSPDLILLQGPPGTGKTTTLVQVLRAMVARPECARVLVCAPSNRGVQEVLERFLAAVAAAGSSKKDTGNGGGGGGQAARESCDESAEAGGGGCDNSSSSRGGGQGTCVGSDDESWRWCCRTGRWIPPGGDGEGGRISGICESDVALVGDADKVTHGSSSARVFVHWIEDHWAAELTRATESLRHLASRLDGEVEDGEIEEIEEIEGGDEIEGDEGAASTGEHASSDAHFAFCSRADLACKIRIGHTERCAASSDTLLRLLTDASNVAESVRKGLRRRLPYTLKQSGGALEKGLAESTRSLALALTSLKESRGKWPCLLAGGTSHLAREMSGAATALNAASRGLAELREASRQEDRASEMLGSARLVFCTLTVSGCYLVRCMPPVDILVVDEAAQATEPEALIPLGLEPRAMLVCGDPYQLSCTCISRRAKAAGLERSLMQRLMDAGSASRFFFLEVQYRMHPAISAFPSHRFYSGRLKDASTCASRPGLFGAAVDSDSTWLGRPWTFLDVSGNSGHSEERDAGGSVCNSTEAAAVVAIVCALRARGVDIGRTRSLRVLTFYSAQVRCVSRALLAAGVREGVMVGTVDGAQGAESDVVVLSFVRSNNNVTFGPKAFEPGRSAPLHLLWLYLPWLYLLWNESSPVLSLLLSDARPCAGVGRPLSAS